MQVSFSEFIKSKYTTNSAILREISLAIQYGRNIRRVAKSLWNGTIGGPTFVSQLTNVIFLGITRAWLLGAKDAGIKPDELTDKEKKALADMINKELTFIPGFALLIIQNSKARQGRWGTVFSRSQQWEKRFLNARNRAHLMASTNPKLIWKLGKAEKHCTSCGRLDGKVKRNSFWEEKGIEPQSPPNDRLECGGHNCTCELKITDKPLSRGPLPRVP